MEFELRFFFFLVILFTYWAALGLRVRVRASQVALVIKNPPCQCGDLKRLRFTPWVRKNPWTRAW